MIVLKQMLRADETVNLVMEIKGALTNLEHNLHTITIDKVIERMGFPPNWEELKNIERKKENEKRFSE